MSILSDPSNIYTTQVGSTMCCNFDQATGNFHVHHVQNVSPLCEQGKGENRFTVRGVYDRTPPSLGAQFCRYFQRLELFEKVIEIADESFHLFHELLHLSVNSQIYHTLHDLHHSAHTIEHFLHSFCFLGDVARFSQGNLLLDQRKQLDYIQCASRICHVVSHLFATLDLLNRLNLLSLGPIEPLIKYASVISAAGYALWTAALIWKQCHPDRDHQQFSDELAIHLSGCLFEATRLSEFSQGFSPILRISIQKIGSLAGVIHAWILVNRLIGPDVEEITFDLDLSNEPKSPCSSPHCGS